MQTTLLVYRARLRAFRPNARLYLMYVILSGAALGVFRLLFNFYVLSLGFDEALLGRLITVNNLTALIVALPVGYLADVLGRKRSLLVAALGMALSIAGMVLWPQAAVFYAMNALSGVAQSLGGVTMAPFLMENSGEEERTYLFSFASGLQMASAFVGNWLGGYLPSWIGGTLGVAAVSSRAYGGALLLVAAVAALGCLPLLFLRTPSLSRRDRSVFAPLTYAREHPRMLGKLILPMWITSIGAGLIMPFMNVFFRQVHHQPDQVIGTLFAWGSLAMGVGLLLAPALADRMGKMQLVVLSQALSIPFLVTLGFAPWFWLSAGAYYIRLALMNMSGPVYQAFVMEHVEADARATVASLVSMSWSFGWAFSPVVSGWLQVRYGFGPPFAGTIVLYSVAVFLYWKFFWPRVPADDALPVTGD
ncbi:MAG: MFS transporter [Anaerolineae bacterium]|nr:MAG: MFS transporter [Anaerolineae bacterium]